MPLYALGEGVSKGTGALMFGVGACRPRLGVKKCCGPQLMLTRSFRPRVAGPAAALATPCRW